MSNSINQEISFEIENTVMTVEDLINKTEPDVFDPVTTTGYQRKIKESHCEKIIEYIMKKQFFFPSPIICSTRENKKGLLWVVDGQHRIEAFRRLSLSTDKKEKGRYEQIQGCSIPVILLINPKEDIEISTFVTINKTGRKVDTSLAYILQDKLFENLPPEERDKQKRVDYLCVELAQKLIDKKESIWFEQISFDDNPRKEGKFLSLNAFVKSERLLINRLISKKIIDMEWKSEKDFDLLLDKILDCFLEKWKAIENKWYQLFEADMGLRSIIQGPIGCTSINKFINNVILENCKLKTLEEFSAEEVKLISSLDISYEEWIKGVNYSLYSSESGYSIIAKDLQKHCNY